VFVDKISKDHLNDTRGRQKAADHGLSGWVLLDHKDHEFIEDSILAEEAACDN